MKVFHIPLEKIDEISKNVSDLVVTNSMLSQQISYLSDSKAKKTLEELSQAFSRNIQNLQDISMNVRLVELDLQSFDLASFTESEAEKSSTKTSLKIQTKNIKIDASVFDDLTPLFRELIKYIISTNKNVSEIFFEAEQDSSQNIFKIYFLDNRLVEDIDLSDINSIKDTKCELLINKKNDYIIFEIYKSLTLAILDGLNIRVGKSMYILPIVNIVESIQAKKDDIKFTGDGSKSLLMLRDDFIPILKLYEYLGIESDSKDLTKGILIVITNQKTKIAIFVDEFLKQEKVVLKSIDGNFIELKEFSGSTVRGTGQVGLVLNIKSLFEEEKKTLN